MAESVALMAVRQFAEALSDRQAASAVRARIDWKYVLIVIEWFRRRTLLNLRGCRHPHPRQPERLPNRLVPIGFEWENQANPAKRRVYLLNDRMPTGLVV